MTGIDAASDGRHQPRYSLSSKNHFVATTARNQGITTSRSGARSECQTHAGDRIDAAPGRPVTDALEMVVFSRPYEHLAGLVANPTREAITCRSPTPNDWPRSGFASIGSTGDSYGCEHNGPVARLVLTPDTNDLVSWR